MKTYERVGFWKWLYNIILRVKRETPEWFSRFWRNSFSRGLAETILSVLLLMLVPLLTLITDGYMLILLTVGSLILLMLVFLHGLYLFFELTDME